MRVRDVMTTAVITLREDVPVHAAAALLASHGFTAAPVTDGDRRVLGIATEADLVRGRIAPDGWVAEQQLEPPVAAVMTRSPVTVQQMDDLAEVVAMMLDTRIRTVPVVHDGRLVGILTRRDVLRAVARRELTSEDVWRRRWGMASHDRGEPG